MSMSQSSHKLVRGGQGRTTEELEHSGHVCECCAAGILLIILRALFGAV